MPESPRLLFVHAHPDDESLANGATIAHYTARGADVRVVTCTLGEEGEVIGDRWAELAVDRADQLGGYRIGELTAALGALGVGAPHYLGGAGRWRDSGMRGTPGRGRRRFIDADEREAVGALVAIIREQRPHVVVTYDPGGGYGHPDHVHAHTVTTLAVAAAGGDGYPGEPWQVPKFYWTVLAYSAFEAGWRALGRDDLLPDWAIPPREEFDFGYPRRQDRRRRRGRPGGVRGEKGGARRARHPSGRRADRPGLRPVEQHGAADPGRGTLRAGRRLGGGARRARLGNRSACGAWFHRGRYAVGCQTGSHGRNSHGPRPGP